ncbi:MAG: response regulator [Acidobacteriota bacterium]
MTDPSPSQEEHERLRAERDELRDFFDEAPDMFVSVNADDGRVLDCNSTLLKVLGRSRDDVVGAPVTDIYHPTSIGDAQAAFRAFLEHGEAQASSLFLLQPTGEPLPISLRVSAVRDETGRIVRSRSICRDTRLENEVAALKLEARVQEAQRFESLAVLAGGIAHDFNNLLVGILGNAGLALMSVPAESPVRGILQDIEVTAQRAAELTRQMLAYSGKGRFVVEELDLSRLVEEMSHLIEVAVSRKVVLRLDLGEPGIMISADATQVRQVVMNLITNGSEAIGERSGIVSIRTGVVEANEAYLADMIRGPESQPGYFAYLEVSDTGIGMSPEVVERMFDPFYSTKHEGHGLGLAAMLGIVKGHQGAIRVYSETGNGTTIRVLLPLAQPQEPAVERESLEPFEQGDGLVMVVDDEEQVRAVSKRALEMVGYEVVTCVDGREAVEVYRRRHESIRAVLLDMTMPHLDGRETFREMTRIRSDVRVILMSGYNEQDATSFFAGKGLAGFIQKPFSPRELLQAVWERLSDSPAS